jgi:Putative transposase
VHCVVTCGGLSRDGTRWVACRPGFFLPVRVLSRLFRRLFLQDLEEAFEAGRLRLTGSLARLADPVTFARHVARVQATEWVVYAKRPFAGPRQVLHYVGRYTYRVAIANHRLVDIDHGQVRFRWKDYRADSQPKTPPCRHGIHPALFAACAAGGLPAHSVLRAAGQPTQHREARAMSATPWHDAAV